jgi:hypothetical protein
MTLGFLIAAYVAVLMVFSFRASAVYNYVKVQHPDKIDLFKKLSSGGLAASFLSARPPMNSQSPFSWRNLRDLRDAVQADPILSTDPSLNHALENLRYLQWLQAAAVSAIVVALVVATLSPSKPS